MKPPPLALLQRDLQQQAGHALERVSGPSFPFAVKVIATALILALLVYGSLALMGPSGPQARALAAGDWGFLVAVIDVIGSGYWGILTSRTSCDSQCIEQTWLWRKQVRITEITQVKLISLPRLSWIVVPRLVVRTGYGLTTFHAGDPAVLARFKLLAHGR